MSRTPIALSLLILTFTDVSVSAGSLHASTSLFDCQEQSTQETRVMIGVLDLAANDIPEPIAGAISDRLRYDLGSFSIFQVLERTRMAEILQEVGFQLSGACDTEECIVQVGRIIGARKMVAGSISRVNTVYSLQVRIVDIESGRVESQAVSDVDNLEQVLQLASRDVARQLAESVSSGGKNPLSTTNPEVPTRVVSGYVRIVTIPAGASVFAEGEYVGESPVTFQLPEGDRKLSLEKEGFIPHPVTVKVQAGRFVNRKVRLLRSLHRIHQDLGIGTSYGGLYFGIDGNEYDPKTGSAVSCYLSYSMVWKLWKLGIVTKFYYLPAFSERGIGTDSEYVYERMHVSNIWWVVGAGKWLGQAETSLFWVGFNYSNWSIKSDLIATEEKWSQHDDESGLGFSLGYSVYMPLHRTTLNFSAHWLSGMFDTSTTGSPMEVYTWLYSFDISFGLTKPLPIDR